MAELAAPSSCHDARGMWRGPGIHLGKGGRLARKLLEAVYEGKSVEVEVRGRMEECGRADESWSPAVCVEKGALAAVEGGQPFACPHDVVLPHPCAPQQQPCLCPTFPYIRTWGPVLPCASLLGLRLSQREPGLAEAIASLKV